MDSTRYDLENGPDIVRLNLSQTILSDNGVWVCELVVRSERHVVTSEGELILGGLTVIGTPLRHYFILTTIGEIIITCNMDGYKISELREESGETNNYILWSVGESSSSIVQ